MKSEFEEMEYYWKNKLESERNFYENQIKESEKKFNELQFRIDNFETNFPNIKTKVKESLETKDKQQIKLSTFNEVNNMEKKVSIQYIYQIIISKLFNFRLKFMMRKLINLRQKYT